MNLCIQFIIPFNNPPIAVSEETELEDCKGGFPHSEMFGSQGARASPNLIAACHVLHRLSMPRHPSEALMRLIVLSKTHAWFIPPDWKVAGGPSLIFVRQCLLLELDLQAQGSRSRSSFTISMHANPKADGKLECDHKILVEPDGVEPTTSCLQSRRSTN